MRIKAHADAAGLCGSCRNAHVHEFSNGERVTTCREAFGLHAYGRITRPVARCSDYDEKNTASKWDMEKIAWTVTTDKSGLTIGFKPPKPEKD